MRKTEKSMMPLLNLILIPKSGNIKKNTTKIMRKTSSETRLDTINLLKTFETDLSRISGQDPRRALKRRYTRNMIICSNQNSRRRLKQKGKIFLYNRFNQA